MANGTRFTRPRSLDDPYPDVRAVIQQQGEFLPSDALNGAEWSLTDAATASRLRGMSAVGVPLGEYVRGQIYRGVLTGFNTAFVLDGATRARLIADDAKSAEIIKPLVVGKDIHKWRIIDRDRWLIVTKIGVEIARYPAIFAHLQQWQEQLEKRWDKGRHWWELRSCDYYAAFDQPKIIYPVIVKSPTFAFDETGAFTNDKGYIIPVSDFYLLGVLNSSSAWEIIASVCSPLRGGFFEMRAAHLAKIPIPDAPTSERTAIADLVQHCLDARGVGCAAWEAEIDARVARLYGLGT